MSQPIRFPATVVQVTRHTPNVASYRFQSGMRLPRFTPGHFVHLALDAFDPAGFWPESRVFSVANAVADRRTVDLTISRQGSYTSRILDGLREGDAVWMKGPYGDFAIGNDQGYHRAVLIAGGTGITPFCSFMDAALNQGRLPIDQVWLYYGVQTPDLLIYRPLADRCATKLTGFHVRYFAERAPLNSDRVLSEGRLDPETILDETSSDPGTAFFLSGPNAMIDLFREQLVNQHGISAEKVLVDAWE